MLKRHLYCSFVPASQTSPFWAITTITELNHNNHGVRKKKNTWAFRAHVLNKRTPQIWKMAVAVSGACRKMGPVSGLPHLAMFLLVIAWSSTSFANERSTRYREHPRNILSAHTYMTYLLRSYPVSGSSDHWFQRTIISVMPWKVFGGCKDPAREVIQWNTSAWYQQGFSRSPVSGHVWSSSLQWEKMTWARNSLNHWNRQWEEFPSVLEMAIEEAS